MPYGEYKCIFPDISVKTAPLNHGRSISTAFFMRHDPSRREFLFFGDVEPDAIVETPKTINVWRAAAPKIPEILSCIFIECSWASGRKNELLFGHLTPEHLGNELAVLASEVVKHRRALRSDPGRSPSRNWWRRNSVASQDLRGALSGVRVYIIHCKEDMDSITIRPTREIILEQCRQVMEDLGLGAEILLAAQGIHIGRRCSHAARSFPSMTSCFRDIIFKFGVVFNKCSANVGNLPHESFAFVYLDPNYCSFNFFFGIVDFLR